MNKFIKEMLKSGVNFKNVKSGCRIFKHIPTNSGVYLSIQCSTFHYCEPNKLIPIQKYKSYEVAIISSEGYFCNNGLENFKRKKELYENHDCGGVFGFVPPDLVEDLYNYLMEEKQND